ncbi:MAG: zinc ABC transporter substrate-binding protein [Gemmataceae bacterium]|nr:zinc ABC transporter substrate-binding protein [Gemmataceae bacterium]MCI0737842.1 zinc ABC transporter substrate-binding protein [Gemmataceae bacterium]
MIAIVGVPLLAGCGDSTRAAHEKKTIQIEKPYAGSHPINAVCTTGMVADLVRHVGGPHVTVQQILGADIDPHTYKATTADTRLISQADVILYSGLHLEGKMGEIFERMSRKIPTFAVAEYLDNSLILEDEDKAHDPHVWFDVSLWSQAVGIVRDVLVKFDPKNAADYTDRAEKYQVRLAKLHDWAKKEIATIPKEQRVLITSHDAFQYFGAAYDVEVKGIQGISTDAEASVKDIRDLVQFITKRNVKAVFVETSVNPRNMRSLIEGCEASGHKVLEGGELFSDAMGPENTPTGNYIGMIEHNVNTIVRALK